MKAPTASELIFSLKTYAAAMLALYLALRIGLPRPFWAMLTAYIVTNPLSGAVRSKAVYRVIGTFLGAVVTVLLVPWMSNAPELLSMSLALWVGVCLYISLLDRTPRSYLFMLAGYTAALIGFSVMTEPSTVFDVALARGEEIMLGVLCATLIHSLVFPSSLGPALLVRLDRTVADSQRWIEDALSGGLASRSVQDRNKLAIDITELRLMATHLPFDTSHLRWTSRAVNALQDRMSAIVPLLSAIEDRLNALRDEGMVLSAEWRSVLDDIISWSREQEHDAVHVRVRAEELRSALEAAAPIANDNACWSDVLQINLAVQLRTLVTAWEELRLLRGKIEAGLHGGHDVALQSINGVSPLMLHRDHRIALLSAAAAVLAIGASCAFWIGTAWPAGAGAASIAAVICCLFAAQDDPKVAMRPFISNNLLFSMPISGIYLLGILPAIHSFEMLILVTMPVFVPLGAYMGRPTTAPWAMTLLLGTISGFTLQDSGNGNLESFINIMVAQSVGMVTAVWAMAVLRSFSAERTAHRLLRAGWNELSGIGKPLRPPSVSEISARMLDRIGLLVPRLALPGSHQDLTPTDALRDLRIGLNMSILVSNRKAASSRELCALMDGLSEHFRQQLQHPAAANRELLMHIDVEINAASVSNDRNVVAALVGIRRDLFPDARGYAPGSHSVPLREVQR